MVFNLEKGIVQHINQESAIIGYDLPYALTTKRLENLEDLVGNAPVAYSMEIKESPCYPGGMFIYLENLEKI